MSMIFEAFEKKICNDTLRYGKIVKDNEIICNGAFVRRYVVEYDSLILDMLKVNGEWVYCTERR